MRNNHLLSPSPRPALWEIKNTPDTGGKALTRSSATNRRKSLLSADCYKTPTHIRRHSSVHPQHALPPPGPPPTSKPHHPRRNSIAQASATPVTPFTHGLRPPPTAPPASRGFRKQDAMLSPCVRILPDQDRKLKHRSLPAAPTTGMRNASLTTPARPLSLASAPAVTPGFKLSRPPGSSHTRRMSIPKSPMIILSSPHPALATPRTPRPGSSTAHVTPRKLVATSNDGEIQEDEVELKEQGSSINVSTGKKFSSGASTATLQLKTTAFRPDTTSLFLSTVSFTALKTPCLVRDDTCHLPSVAVIGESPTMLLMDTPSFVAVRNSESNPFFSPPTYNNLLTPTRGGAKSDEPRLLFSSDDQSLLCATPSKAFNEAVDNSLLQVPSTYAQSPNGYCVPSQSRSLLFLVNALEQAAPSLGQSLFSELPASTTELAGLEDYSFEVAMTQDTDGGAQDEGEGTRNPNRDTLVLLDEFEILAAETRALPIPRPPSLSPTEWETALDESESVDAAMEIILDYDDEPCLTPTDGGYSGDDQFARFHSDTSTIGTARPSIDSGRTQSPTPPVTPVDPCFPPVVHIISPPRSTSESTPSDVDSETHRVVYTEVKEEKSPQPSDQLPTLYMGDHTTPSRTKALPTPSIPRSIPLPRASPARRFASSPIPQTTTSAIPRSPGLLSTVRTPAQHQNYRPVSPTPMPPPSVTSSSGLRRLFKPRQSAPPMFASPGVNRMKNLLPGLRADKNKSAGWGDSFLDM
ncbi:hypothetical protein EIP91_011496 [Steccherinum ochraceum]|uniref:Uncharacterized protein n=1 Tax=Steccherinum ochraceum TaxID=92696 RepID=A0A4R0RID0_9APHY|nr:hypothetical protein EIP91_011496 [Steccherinum ochraceum]